MNEPKPLIIITCASSGIGEGIVKDGHLSSLLENKEGHFYKLWVKQAEGFISSVSEESFD